MKIAITLLLSLTFFSVSSFAAEEPANKAIEKCLEAWGTHPFGTNPSFKTMATSAKVFGIGSNPKDTQVTSKPTLVLVKPAVNVMGGLTIKADCNAHLASASGGATVMGSSNADTEKGVTVMGSTSVQLVNCKK